MEETIDKRKKVSVSKEEADILKWLFVKTLVPVVLIILISSAVLYFGLEFLMKQTGFDNYGLAPGITIRNVSRFVSAYMIIALVNVLLMVTLSVIVMYAALRNIILPVIRITREMKDCIESKARITLTVRKSDRLLIPLVEMINRFSLHK